MSIRVGFGPRSSAPLIWIKRTGALRRCEGRQADDECGVTFVLSTFEAAAEPSEGSVVEVEPPLAEGGGIEPFAAGKSNFHAAWRRTSSNADVLNARSRHPFHQARQYVVESLRSNVGMGVLDGGREFKLDVLQRRMRRESACESLQEKLLVLRRRHQIGGFRHASFPGPLHELRDQFVHGSRLLGLEKL